MIKAEVVADSISLEEAKKYLSYDPDTGLLTRLIGTGKGAAVGAKAGCVGKRGYRVVSIKGTPYYVHRVAWLLFYGEWPGSFIDHVDGNKDNNRIDNLRLVTKIQNAQNAKAHHDSSSGLKGAFKTRREDRWRSQIRINGTLHNLGVFDTPEDAHAAYCKAAKTHFGSFARTK